MIQPFDVYKEFIALKLHFTDPDYDYLKYNGQTKIDENNFNLNANQLTCINLARKYETQINIKELFLSNMVAGKLEEWLPYYLTDAASDIRLRWVKGVGSLSYVVQEESKRIRKFLDDDKVKFAELFVCKDGQHPLLLKYYYAGVISLETLIAYALIFKFLPKWNREIKDPLMFPETYRMIKKYRPFLNYDIKDIQDRLKGIYITD